MPAIYSFSLDHKYDKDIIHRLEGMKNRSSWIRQMLRQELDHERLKILVEILYESYKTQMFMRGLDSNTKSLYSFRERADKIWATRIDQPERLHVHQESHNSSQEQE